MLFLTSDFGFNARCRRPLKVYSKIHAISHRRQITRAEHLDIRSYLQRYYFRSLKWRAIEWGVVFEIEPYMLSTFVCDFVDTNLPSGIINSSAPIGSLVQTLSSGRVSSRQLHNSPSPLLCSSKRTQKGSHLFFSRLVNATFTHWITFS